MKSISPRAWTTKEKKIVEQCAEEGLTQQRTVVVLEENGYNGRNRNAVARFATRNGIKFDGQPYRYGNNNRWRNHIKRGKDPTKRKIRDKRYRQKIKAGYKPLSKAKWLAKRRVRRFRRLRKNERKFNEDRNN